VGDLLNQRKERFSPTRILCREAAKRRKGRRIGPSLCRRSDAKEEDRTRRKAGKEEEKIRGDMGKRKSSAKAAPKKRMEKLSTVFSCPFCNHENSVECRMYVFNFLLPLACSLLLRSCSPGGFHA
jgi:hypothetical protein